MIINDKRINITDLVINDGFIYGKFASSDDYSGDIILYEDVLDVSFYVKINQVIPGKLNYYLFDSNISSLNLDKKVNPYHFQNVSTSSITNQIIPGCTIIPSLNKIISYCSINDTRLNNLNILCNQINAFYRVNKEISITDGSLDPTIDINYLQKNLISSNFNSITVTYEDFKKVYQKRLYFNNCSIRLTNKSVIIYL